MGPQEKITITDREDLGPVLARADHALNVIEVNKAAFYKLPPMMQEFVLCHEVCHLKHDEWDEERTNQLAASLFLSRANGAEDLEQRKRFLTYVDDRGGYSNFAWEVLIGSVLSFGTTVFGIIKQRNSGWYSWDDATRKSNIDVMLSRSFEQSRRSSQASAAEYFWQQLSNYTFKDNSLDQFLGRSDNAWVKSRIAAYEKQYGFKFDEVTPVDLTAFPLAIVAIGALVGFVVYKIIKRTRK